MSIAAVTLSIGCSTLHGAYQRETDVAGYRVRFVADPLIVGERNEATVVLTQDGAPVDDATVRVRLTMPEMAMGSTLVSLAQRGGGRYDGELRLSMSGHWRARVSARRRGGREATTDFDFEARDR